MNRLRASIDSTIRASVRFLRAEDGPTAVEYAVLLALIVVTCLASVRALGPVLLASFRSSAQTVGTYGVAE